MGHGNVREGVAGFFAEVLKRHRPYQWLVLAAVVAVPLQQLPVVDVGFPLKITEVLIFVALVAWACDPWRTFGVRRPEVCILAAFAAVTVISTVYALLNASPDARYNGIAHSLAFDSFLYFGYGAVIFAFWALLRTVPSASIHRSVIYAVYIAAAAVAVQFIAAQLEAFDLLHALGFRVDVWGAQFGPLVSLRTGSFVEGQHLGFFAGAALIVSVQRRSVSGYVAAGLAALCVIYSQSTTAFAGVALALVITCILRPRLRTLLVVGGTGLLALVVVLVVPPLRGLVAYQLAKVGLFPGESPEGAGVSLDIRGEKTAVGFDIMWANPLTGAGPGRYGVWFQQFVDPDAVPARYFERDDMRAIAENVYAQIAAEYGIFGILLFIAFLVCVFLRMRRSQFVDVALIVYIAIAIATQSSWTFLPIWAFLGYLASVSAESDEPIWRRKCKEPTSTELGPRRRYRAEAEHPRTSDTG